MNVERAGGGWYPPDNGLSAPDLYAAWLHQHGYENSPVRRAEFERETGLRLTPTQTALAAKAFLERIDNETFLGIIETRAKLGGWVGSREAGSWDGRLSDAIAVGAWNAVLDLFRAWAAEAGEPE